MITQLNTLAQVAAHFGTDLGAAEAVVFSPVENRLAVMALTGDAPLSVEVWNRLIGVVKEARRESGLGLWEEGHIWRTADEWPSDQLGWLRPGAEVLATKYGMPCLGEVLAVTSVHFQPVYRCRVLWGDDNPLRANTIGETDLTPDMFDR